MLTPEQYFAIRSAIANIPGDLSNDAVGAQAPKREDIYPPERHATALDPLIPIVLGSRGAGKSFWAGVLGQDDTRKAAALAYPRLGLDDVRVAFGFTGALGGPDGVSNVALSKLVPENANADDARAFWWATILLAANRSDGQNPKLSELFQLATDWEQLEEAINERDTLLRDEGAILLVVYDALDTVATTWPRRRLLTETLLEVVWAMRAYRSIKVKIFIRPDQIDDDALRFVELPKLRTGAVQIVWSGTDLYGLLFSRLALAPEQRAVSSFQELLLSLSISSADQTQILQRHWSLAHNADDQARVMAQLAGPYMGSGHYGYKKGKTYDWPLNHLGDAFQEVTPRSFLGLMTAAAKRDAPPDRAFTAEGLRHGLREASKTRVDQLHLEFPWIKGVLAPLAGLLLPQEEIVVFEVWKRAKTIEKLIIDATQKKYLPPFPTDRRQNEQQLFEPRGEQQLFDALERIGVMFRRKDGRIDMPDLFRVAAKLLKKGGTAPL